MYKSLYILIVFFVLAGIDASAQNLVLNYNFDNAFTCPHHYTTTAVKELVPHWTNPNKGTPDHFHACSDSLAGVPDNFAGFIYPFDGRAYVGLILREVFDSTHKNVPGVSREYLQTRLTEPMMRNKLYCVSLYYAHASRSAYAVDAMGIAITRDQIRTRDPGNIVQMPQVINRPGRIMNNKESWKELCGVYRARGNEKYLTIGNFLNNEYTRFEKNLDEMTDSTFLYAYYYIDAVRVFEIENHFECGCSEEDSFGMDMMADNYDPKTGYNSLNYTRRLEEDMASMTELGDGNADDLLSDGSLSDSDGDGNAVMLMICFLTGLCLILMVMAMLMICFLTGPCLILMMMAMLMICFLTGLCLILMVMTMLTKQMYYIQEILMVENRFRVPVFIIHMLI